MCPDGESKGKVLLVVEIGDMDEEMGDEIVCPEEESKGSTVELAGEVGDGDKEIGTGMKIVVPDEESEGNAMQVAVETVKGTKRWTMRLCVLIESPRMMP